MTHVTENQPTGTPTWIDLGVPDLDRALQFYGAAFGWEFEVGPPEAGTTPSAAWVVARLPGLWEPTAAPTRTGGTCTSPPTTATPPPDGSPTRAAAWSSSRWT